MNTWAVYFRLSELGQGIGKQKGIELVPQIRNRYDFVAGIDQPVSRMGNKTRGESDALRCRMEPSYVFLEIVTNLGNNPRHDVLTTLTELGEERLMATPQFGRRIDETHDVWHKGLTKNSCSRSHGRVACKQGSPIIAREFMDQAVIGAKSPVA